MKKAKKRVLTLLLALSLLAAPLSAARAQHEFTEITCGPITYCINETILIDDEPPYAGVKRCDPDAAGTVVIPAEINGFPVKGIGDNAFRGCEKVKEVVLPEGLRSIDQSFLQCSALERVNIPRSVYAISEFAFFDCDQVTLEVPACTYAHAYAQVYRVPYAFAQGHDADLNGDGQISVLDALMILQILVDLIPSPSDNQQTAADVDGSGVIDTADALAVLQHIVFGTAQWPYWSYPEAPRNCVELISHCNSPEAQPKIIQSCRFLRDEMRGGSYQTDSGRVFVDYIVSFYRCDITDLDGTNPQTIELELENICHILNRLYMEQGKAIAFFYPSRFTKKLCLRDDTRYIAYDLFSLRDGMVTSCIPVNESSVLPADFQLTFEQFCELVYA